MDIKKFLFRMERMYQKNTAVFPNQRKKEKQERIGDTLSVASLMFKSHRGFRFGIVEFAILKWKLAQYFQNNESIDRNDLWEALVFDPSFLEDNEKRISHAIQNFKAFQKKAQKIRRKEALTFIDSEPEELLVSSSGKYKLVQLTSWKHLYDESAEMDHCIGRQSLDFYSVRIARGQYELFSFRNLHGSSIITILFDKERNKIREIRKVGHHRLGGNEYYYPEFIEILNLLREMNIKETGLLGFGIYEGELAMFSFLDLDEEEKHDDSKKEVNLCFLKGVTLIDLSIHDLGLDNEVRFNYEQVCSLAHDLGYKLCSLEEVGAYAFQFPVQDEYSFYYFGMDMKDTEGKTFYVVLGNNGEGQHLFLDGKETQNFVTRHCLEFKIKFVFKTSRREIREEIGLTSD